MATSGSSFLDDEDHTWKVEQTSEAPRPGTVEGDDEFRYPPTDLSHRFAVRGQVIHRLSEADLGVLARAKVEFSTGQTLVLDYAYSTEKATVVLEPLANPAAAADGASPRR